MALILFFIYYKRKLMNKQNLCESNYFPAMVIIIAAGMIIQIIRAGIDFGHWLYTFMH